MNNKQNNVMMEFNEKLNFSFFFSMMNRTLPNMPICRKFWNYFCQFTNPQRKILVDAIKKKREFSFPHESKHYVLPQGKSIFCLHQPNFAYNNEMISEISDISLNLISLFFFTLGLEIVKYTEFYDYQLQRKKY